MAAKSDWRSPGVIELTDGRSVCPWCVADPVYVRYHDRSGAGRCTMTRSYLSFCASRARRPGSAG